jgi:hypothetical protein
MRHNHHVSPIAMPELRRVRAGIVLEPTPLFPKVRQHVEQKNDACAIQHQENRHGHWTSSRLARE